MKVFWGKLDSPVGEITMVATDEGLISLAWSVDGRKPVIPANAEKYDNKILKLAKKELTEYFAGQRTNFSVPVQPSGTAFQRQVWEALNQIPYGQSVSYKDIAVKLKNPAAVRAIGQANGANPVPIIIPCHRVVTASGALGGFSGGLERKRQLLKIEKYEGRLD